MSIRKTVGHSLLSTHLESVEHQEMPIDRIGALARSSDLGISAWRWRYADLPDAKASLQALLRAAEDRFGIGRGTKYHPNLVAACMQALLEWYSPHCRNCSGAGEILTERLRIVCPRCDGVGVHRYDDESRAAAIGVSAEDYRRHWEGWLRDLLSMLTARDAETAAVVREQLER